MINHSIIDARELARFILTGISATVVNISALWLALHFMPYEMALVPGILAGMTISFTLSKLFAFKKRSWSQVTSEAARFLIVYAIGSTTCWIVAVVVRIIALERGILPQVAAIGSALIGAATMLVTSYFGHRFYTYRTHLRTLTNLPPFEDRRAFRWEQLVILALLSFIILLLAMPRDLNIFDEGIILTGAMRTMAGEVLHRDFYSSYGPGQYYTIATLFHFFGVNFIVARIYDVAMRATIMAAMYHALRRQCSFFFSLFFTAISGLWFLGIGAYLYPIFPCMLLALLGSFLVIEGTKTTIFGAGILTGIAALFRYDVGFFVLIAHLFSLATLRSRSSHSELRARNIVLAVFSYGAGTAIIFVPAAFLFLLRSPLAPFFADIVDYSRNYYPTMRGLPFPGIHALHANPIDSAVYLPLIAVALGAGEFIYSSARRGRTMQSSHSHDDLSTNCLLVFGTLTLMLFFKGWVRVSALHMLLSIIPALIVFSLLTERWWKRSQLMRCVTVLVLIITSVPAAIAATRDLSQSIHIADRSLAGWLMLQSGILHSPKLQNACEMGPASGIAKFSPDYSRIATYIGARTQPDERILVALDRHDKIFANSIGLYFAAGRLPGTHWQQFDPGLTSRADIQTDMIAELQEFHVHWVVRDANFDEIYEPNGSALSSGVTLLDDYLAKNYHPVAFAGNIKIWLQNGFVPTDPIHPIKCDAIPVLSAGSQ
jgi:putative flippase GtrA